MAAVVLHGHRGRLCAVDANKTAHPHGGTDRSQAVLLATSPGDVLGHYNSVTPDTGCVCVRVCETGFYNQDDF